MILLMGCSNKSCIDDCLDGNTRESTNDFAILYYTCTELNNCYDNEMTEYECCNECDILAQIFCEQKCNIQK